MREVNKLLGEAEAPNENSEENTSSRPQLVRSLLSVEPKNLNPENEMKRIFGSKVVLGEHANRGGGHRRGHRQRAHRTSHWLVVPKPSWPQPGKTGLAMKFLESDRNSYQYFTFEHSSNYQLVQKRFFHAVESLNPEHIIVSGSNFFILCQYFYNDTSRYSASLFHRQTFATRVHQIYYL